MGDYRLKEVTMKKTGLLMGVVLVALLATACEMRFYMDLTVEDDGSGTMAFDLTADGELRELTGGQMDIAELLNADPSQPCDVEPLSDGDFQGARMTCPFASLEELMDDMIAPMGEDYDPTMPQPMSGFQLERDGDVFLLRMDATDINASYDLTSGFDGGDWDLDDPYADEAPMDMSSFLDIRFTATLPGEIISHNADFVDGAALTWSFPTAEPWLMAESRVRSGMSPIAIWFLIAVGVVVLVMIILRTMPKKPEQDPAPPDDGETPDASDGDESEDDTEDPALPKPDPGQPDDDGEATVEPEAPEDAPESETEETEEEDEAETGKPANG